MDILNFKEFEVALRRKFNLDEDGALVGEDMLVHVGKHRSKTALDRFNVIPIADTTLHFRASSIMDGADAEVVHVTEPGKYFDHVFCNKREGDLYTVDDFDDFEEEVDIDEYKALTGAEKIERMPFFKHLVAMNLTDFLGGIQIMTEDEFYQDEVDADAERQDDGSWCKGKSIDGKRDGRFEFWDASGFRTQIAFYDEGSLTTAHIYHSAGAGSLDFEKEEGTVNRYTTPTIRYAILAMAGRAFRAPRLTRLRSSYQISIGPLGPTPFPSRSIGMRSVASSLTKARCHRLRWPARAASRSKFGAMTPASR